DCPVDAAGAAMAREERRVKVNRLVARRVENSLGNYQRDEREDGEVGVQRLEILEGGVVLERFGLAERQARRARPGGQRIRLAGGRIGRCEDVNDLVA